MQQKPFLFACIVIFGLCISGCSSGPYSGGLRYGEAYGEGVYRYPDGSKYKGTFLYGKEHGFGTLTSAEGEVSQVTFHNGTRIYTEAEIKKMLYWFDQDAASEAKTQSVMAASKRADYKAILKDRKRREKLTNSNAFRDGRNLTGGASSVIDLHLGSKNLSVQGSPQNTTDIQTNQDCIKPNYCEDEGSSCEQAQAAYLGCIEGWSQDDWRKYYSEKNSGKMKEGKTIQQ